MGSEVDDEPVAGCRQDVEQLAADAVRRVPGDADEYILTNVAGALRTAHGDEAVPVRVVPDAHVVAVELGLPLPVVEDVGPVLHAPVGRPHQTGILGIYLVEAVALVRVYAGLRSAYGPEPVSPRNLVEQPVEAVEEEPGADVVLLVRLDLIDEPQAVDVFQPRKGVRVDVRRQAVSRLASQLPERYRGRPSATVCAGRGGVAWGTCESCASAPSSYGCDKSASFK